MVFLQSWNCSENSFVNLQSIFKTLQKEIKSPTHKGRSPKKKIKEEERSNNKIQTNLFEDQMRVVDSDKLFGTFFSSIEVPLKTVSCTSFW